MKIISVGPDEITISEDVIPKGVDVIIYWYESGCYEGHGDAIAIGEKVAYEAGLSHCSCYGPLEDSTDWAGPNKTPEDLKKEVEQWAREPRWNDSDREPWQKILAAWNAYELTGGYDAHCGNA